ncbi:MAG: hypothetical protein IVW55_03315 [Chloroflexi bacterium]|nr:hypothetical protein [Chloroflexota bacterium]
MRPLFAQERRARSYHTHYFTIYYPAGEQQSAQGYAGFADDSDAAVSGLLEPEPAPNLTLRIYATEAAYSAVKRMAAHALPNEGEVGVAVERLLQQRTNLPKENAQWL